MPRKERVQKQAPTRAEAFNAWLAVSRDALVSRDRLDEPFEAWEVDSFGGFIRADVLSRAIEGCRHGPNCVELPKYRLKGLSEKEERARLVRETVYRITLAAVYRADELYRRREEQKQHTDRAEKARALAKALNDFMRDGWKDAPAHGLRGLDGASINESQMARYARATERPAQTMSGAAKLEALAAGEHVELSDEALPASEWENILRAGTFLVQALEQFATDRDTLELPPGDATDVLGMIVIGNIVAVATSLFVDDMCESDLHRFALAAWRDMGLPLPDARAKEGAEQEWMEKKFGAFGKLAPEKKRALGY